MNDERREHKRFTVTDLDLILQEEEKLIGKVVNLSEGGLLILSTAELESGKAYDFRIPFDQTVNGEIHFDFEGEVVWCNQNTLDAKKFSAGLKFTQIPDLQLTFVKQMITIFGK